MTAAIRLAAAIDPVAQAIAGPHPRRRAGRGHRGGRPRRRASSASRSASRTAVPMRRDTWFDLASLTKVLFTTPAILRLAAQGRIALDDPLTVAIPDLRQYDRDAAERRLTFRQCLAHQTHLPAVEPLYTYGQDPATLRAFILQRVWQAGPPVYSDINFMLLGIAIERLTGRAARRAGAARRACRSAPTRPNCAATERCTWRGRVMRGEVHDENAFALGRRRRPCRAVRHHRCRAGCGAGPAAGRRAGAGRHARCGSRPRARWGGRRAHDGWSGGEPCSEDTIGHTGFTGTGLWIDFGAGDRLDAADQPGASDAPPRHRHRGAAPAGRRPDLPERRHEGVVALLAACCCWPRCRRGRAARRWTRCCVPTRTRWPVSTAPT